MTYKVTIKVYLRPELHLSINTDRSVPKDYSCLTEENQTYLKEFFDKDFKNWLASIFINDEECEDLELNGVNFVLLENVGLLRLDISVLTTRLPLGPFDIRGMIQNLEHSIRYWQIDNKKNSVEDLRLYMERKDDKNDDLFFDFSEDEEEEDDKTESYPELYYGVRLVENFPLFAVYDYHVIYARTVTMKQAVYGKLCPYRKKERKTRGYVPRPTITHLSLLEPEERCFEYTHGHKKLEYSVKITEDIECKSGELLCLPYSFFYALVGTRKQTEKRRQKKRKKKINLDLGRSLKKIRTKKIEDFDEICNKIQRINLTPNGSQPTGLTDKDYMMMDTQVQKINEEFM